MRLHTLRLLFMFMFYQVIIYGQQVKMSYQAVVRNSSNILVTNTAVGMRISILQGTATGIVVINLGSKGTGII